MSANGELFLKMREDDFNNLNPEVRGKFTYIEKVEVNEYETHRNDQNYISLYKEQKKAKDNLKEYLFNKRHKQ